MNILQESSAFDFSDHTLRRLWILRDPAARWLLFGRHTQRPRGRFLLLGILVGILLPVPVRSSTFSSGANGAVNCFALQPDGKIIVAGSFTTLSGQPCTNLGRLNGDGALDLSFKANVPDGIEMLVLQPDGKLIVGGWFTTLGGTPCTGLGRLNRDGTVDSTFDAAIDPYSYSSINCMAQQPDGKLYVGGTFTTLGGQACTNLGRLNSDGTLDPAFSTVAQRVIKCLALQPDGKLLVGGMFTTLGGQPCHNLGRLNGDGTVDPTFISAAPEPIYITSLAVQRDGKVLVGGITYLSRLTGDGTSDPSFQQTRSRFGLHAPFMIPAVQTDGKIMLLADITLHRFNADGTEDTNFVSESNSTDLSVAIQPDGEILIGGDFGLLDNQARQCIGRVENTGPANQSLSFDGSTITWLRSGTGPEFWCVSFEGATNGMEWINLGAGSPMAGGWQLAGVSFPANGNIRARGFVAGSGFDTKAAWVVENYLGAPVVVGQPAALVYYSGLPATLSAGVAGTEPLAYQWIFHGSVLSGATNALLILTNIQPSQAGQYMVIATNVYGSVTNTVGTLTVTAPPEIPPIVLQGLQLTNGSIRFSWNTVFGLNYEILYSTSPDKPIWTLFNDPLTISSILSGSYGYLWRSTNQSLIFTAGGSSLTLTAPCRPEPRRFYRIRYAQ